HRIRQALQPRRELREFLVPEVIVARPCCKDQMVIRNPTLLPIAIHGNNLPLVFVHPNHIRQHPGRVRFPSQQPPNRRSHLARAPAPLSPPGTAAAETGGDCSDRSPQPSPEPPAAP